MRSGVCISTSSAVVTGLTKVSSQSINERQASCAEGYDLRSMGLQWRRSLRAAAPQRNSQVTCVVSSWIVWLPGSRRSTRSTSRSDLCTTMLVSTLQKRFARSRLTLDGKCTHRAAQALHQQTNTMEMKWVADRTTSSQRPKRSLVQVIKLTLERSPLNATMRLKDDLLSKHRSNDLTHKSCCYKSNSQLTNPSRSDRKQLAELHRRPAETNRTSCCKRSRSDISEHN